MPSNSSKSNWICFLFGFFIASVTILSCLWFTVGSFIEMPDFWDVRFFELIKFVATIFIAVYFAYYLKNRYSDRQDQKKLFIGILDDISNIYDEPEEMLAYLRKANKTQEDRNNINLSFKRTTNKIYILKEQKERFNSKVAELVDSLDREHLKIRELVCDEPIYNDGTDVFPNHEIGEVMKSVTNMILWSDEAKLNLFE